MKTWSKYFTLEWAIAIFLVALVLGLAVSDNAKGQWTTTTRKKCYPEEGFNKIMKAKYREEPVMTVVHKAETYILYVNMETRAFSVGKRIIHGHDAQVCFLGGGSNLRKYNGPVKPT